MTGLEYTPVASRTTFGLLPVFSSSGLEIPSAAAIPLFVCATLIGLPSGFPKETKPWQWLHPFETSNASTGASPSIIS